MHTWGDDWPYWEDLNRAIHFIWWVCTKIGRIGVHSKEKYGTHRMTTYFWNGSFHSLIYPGYCYSQFPQWLWTFDIYYITKFMQWLRFPIWIVFQYQRCVFALAFYIAMKKHPHIADEIASDVDYYQGIIGGKKIHDKYWRQVIPDGGEDE